MVIDTIQHWTKNKAHLLPNITKSGLPLLKAHTFVGDYAENKLL